MKTNVFRGFLLIAGLALAFAGCDTGSSPSTKATVTEVTIEPATPTVAKGATLQFSATVIGTHSPAQTVIWEVAGGIAATVIGNNGVLSVSAHETAATLTVKATSTVDTSKSGTVTVTVTASAEEPPLTGAVTITGTEKVGHTLTADTSSLNGSGAISYQWKRADNASGANSANLGTGETYVLVTADKDKYIRVTVTRAGYTGSIDSSWTGPVTAATDETPLTGVIEITGTEKVGQTLTANTSRLNGSGAITYSWHRADNTSGANSSTLAATGVTYTLVTADEGKFIKVTVTRADNTGSVGSDWAGPILAENALTPTVTEVTVSAHGNATHVSPGDTLQFNAVVHGENSPAQTVTWTIEGTDHAAGTTISPTGLLTVAAAETATMLVIKATSTVDTSKYEEAEITVIPNTPTVSTVTIMPQPTPPQTSISIGKGQTGQFYATVTGTNSPAQTVTWTIEGTHATGTTLVSGLLTIAADETATTFTVRATSTVDTNKFGTVTVTIPVVTPPLTGMVSINGLAQVGSILTANITQLLGAGTITYVWKRANDAAGTGSAVISGAASGTYLLIGADEGKHITVTVTRSGYEGSKTSEATAAVAPAPASTGELEGEITIGNGIHNEHITFDKAGEPSLPKNGTLTITVQGTYQSYRWFIDGLELGEEKGSSLELKGADYTPGKTYRIVVIVYRNGIPYSQAIQFTVGQ